MLTILLVWIVALGSLSIFGAGMIFPELSRKNDLIWVGVGLFYALILWANTGNIGGGLLLGQTAGISLTVWLGWQMMTQRRELTTPDKKTPVPDWLQKILDIVTPLVQKASGFITAQLGVETTPEGQMTEESESGLSDFKSKALGFLDKLNPKASDTTVVEELSESEESSMEEEEAKSPDVEVPEPEPNDGDSDSPTSVASNAVAADVEVTPDSQTQVDVSPPADADASNDSPSTESNETTAVEVTEVKVTEVEVSHEEVEPPADASTSTSEINEPTNVKNSVPIQEATAETIEPPPPAASEEAPVAEEIKSEEIKSEEPNSDVTDDPVEARLPDDSGDNSESTATEQAEEQPEAAAPESPAEDQVQEESNWPPEPDD